MAEPATTTDAAANHAVARLRAECVARSRKPFVARGARSDRCPDCRVPAAHCLCALRPRVATRSGFCLLMHGDEPMKPSNTGWLVADVVTDTDAFAWSRTQADPRLLALLADPRRAPYVVFPEEAAPHRAVRAVEPSTDRRPLFVVFDATWAEARKMFRKSPYLDRFPVLTLDVGAPSRYRLRRTRLQTNLCTAEVAARCLRLVGENAAASELDAWLDAFVDLSMRLRGRS
jgi:DTW domain-containing protein YfiP